MWLIFIGIGILLIAAYLYFQGEQKSTAPLPPNFKYFLYGLSAVLIATAAYLFYSVGGASGWDAFSRFVFAVIMFIAAVKCIGAGRDADQKYAVDMRARADAVGEHGRHEENAIRLENARLEALYREQLAAARRATDLIQMELERRKAILEINLASTAEDKGVNTAALIDINTHYWKKEIDLAARATEYSQNQDTIDRVEHAQIGLVDKQTQRLFRMYEERKALESSNDAAKDDKLRQLNQNISIAEELLRGEQNRLIQATLGKVGTRSISG